MKKKNTFFSFFCGILLFLLTFVFQILVKVYSIGTSLKGMYVFDSIFLIIYITVFKFVLGRYENTNKIVLYIIIPSVIGYAVYIFSSIYFNLFYSIRFNINMTGFMIFYFATGFWSVGVFAGLIELIIFCIQQGEDCSIVDKKDD